MDKETFEALAEDRDFKEYLFRVILDMLRVAIISRRLNENTNNR